MSEVPTAGPVAGREVPTILSRQIPKMAVATPHPAPSVKVREVAAVLLLVVLGDLTLYRGAGYLGLAALVFAGPLVLLLGSPQPKLRASFWVVTGLILLMAFRLAWLGSVAAVLVAIVLALAYSLTLQGTRPYLSVVFARGLETTIAGGFALAQYAGTLGGIAPRLPRLFWLNILLPGAALGIFGTLFTLANPDLVTSLTQIAETLSKQLEAWVGRFSENSVEFVVWFLVAWVGAGLIRPLSFTLPARQPLQCEAVLNEQQGDWPFYVAVRNTLIGVIGLFAVYLVFEFVTLWFRKFPPGFYYAGYAHQGAAWLTIALALATLVLSLIFRGSLLCDHRSGRLRTLAWIWSAENLVLALTVYNRMYIYINFNGMTWTRMVGLFGISTVVVGFGLVVWRIAHNRNFSWLIQRQLWALAGAVYLFVLTPVDVIVHSYNVRQVLSGDLAPAVQISVHPISTEGYLVLQPLTHCNDVLIRDGIQAMLAERFIKEQQLVAERDSLGWSTWQLSDSLLLTQLQNTTGEWERFLNDGKREAALKKFRDYAYQWY